MLFNSPEFLLLFLPATLLGFLLVGKKKFFCTAWLVGASAVFYADWSVRYLVLLIGLMVVNFLLGRAIYAVPSTRLLAAGIALNLSVLGYFKYFNFFIGNIAEMLGISIAFSMVILPLGISFFTFQKVAYLIDSYRREIPPHSFLGYALFVLFFPQLIAGPIVHAREILPQLAIFQSAQRLSNIGIGLTIFVIGLSKKMLLADHLALIATPVFDGAAGGQQPHLLAAWAGALAYTLQLYFDFSGYSDMAIGVARMFGIVLPANFASPYKAGSIAEFWRRWHMTLSRFLRDYLYVPLGGNRLGHAREYANLVVTMTLGGLWHGAGWTFVVWGLLHGLLLVAEKLWCRMTSFRLPRPAARVVTFFAIIVLWVPFRAASFDSTIAMWSGMLGLNGLVLPASIIELLHLPMVAGWVRVERFGLDPAAAVFWTPIGLAIALFAPNTQTLLRDFKPVAILRDSRTGIDEASGLRWRPAMHVGALVGALLAFCLLQFNNVSEFIYFQF